MFIPSLLFAGTATDPNLFASLKNKKYIHYANSCISMGTTLVLRIDFKIYNKTLLKNPVVKVMQAPILYELLLGTKKAQKN